MQMRLVLLALLLAAAHGVKAAEVLDRTVATVNNHMILLSDWDDEARYECFMSGRQLASITSEERKAALDRLIDQELLREQMHASESKTVTADQVQKRIDELKKEIVPAQKGATWEQELSEYDLTEKFIEGRVATELGELQFIDARFRPSVQVLPAEIEEYYRGQLVPKLPSSDPVSLAQATPQIREILIQNKIDQALHSWLETLRAQAQIRFLPTPETGSAPSETPPQVGKP